VADQVPQEASEKVYTKWFDYDIIRDAVSIRTRKPGDYLAIHSDGKTQKLKSYFINEKIPAKSRERILLIAEGHQILWVVGYRMSSRYQISEHTKRIIEIKIMEDKKHGRDN
jgi:tRNA(Ile)-lysidine synthase